MSTPETVIGTARCAGIRCHRQPDGPAAASAPGGARLCRACSDLLVIQAGKLPALFAECGRRLSAAGERKAERVSGGPLPTGLPFNSAAADARSAIVGVLGSWSGLIADGRGITAPRRDVAAMAEYLVRHADWLSAHAAAGDGSREIDQITRQARRVIEPEDLRRVKVGSCVEDDCVGDLVALVRAERRRDAHPEVRCSLDAAHRWLGHEWLQLSQRLTPTREHTTATAGLGSQRHSPAWLTAADIARLWGIAPGSVYRHASEQSWQRKRLGGLTYYGASDVQTTLNRRPAQS